MCLPTSKYPEAAQYIKDNMKEVCEIKKLTVEDIFYFVNFGFMVAL